jgi:hypothetical protein
MDPADKGGVRDAVGFFGGGGEKMNEIGPVAGTGAPGRGEDEMDMVARPMLLPGGEYNNCRCEVEEVFTVTVSVTTVEAELMVRSIIVTSVSTISIRVPGSSSTDATIFITRSESTGSTLTSTGGSGVDT